MTEITEQHIIHRLPGMDQVVVEQDIPYKTLATGPLGMDVYRSKTTSTDKRPAVILITGYPDPGYLKFVGCRIKETGASISWARLLAAAGFVAISYENTSPAEDAADVLKFVAEQADDYGIDSDRIAIWSCSGNVPCAMNLLIESPQLLNCAVLCYGFMLDLDGASAVADACSQYHFVNATAGRSVAEFGCVPMLLVRAGRDENPGLNDSIDRFVSHALATDLPLTLINYPAGVHAFDLQDNSAGSHRVIEQILDFLRVNLSRQS